MAIPTKTMAVRLFEYGGPDKLVFGEYDLPPLGACDVLVKNFAGPVLRWDVKYRAAIFHVSASGPNRVSAAAAIGPRSGRRGDRHRQRGDALQAGRPRHRHHASGRSRCGRKPRAGSAICRAISLSRATRPSAPTRSISCATNGCGCRCPTASITSKRAWRCGRSRRRTGSCATGSRCGSAIAC